MLLRWRKGRAFTRVLFDQFLPEDAWFDNPIPVRHPFVFYEGHLVAFVVNTLVKGALGRPGVDAMLERLFERGIDPKDEGEGATFAWPTRARVLRLRAPGGSRHRGRDHDDRARRAARAPARAERSPSRDHRARAHASGDAALHAARAAHGREAPARGSRSAPGRGNAAPAPPRLDPFGPRDARPGPRIGEVRAGTTNFPGS